MDLWAQQFISDQYFLEQFVYINLIQDDLLLQVRLKEFNQIPSFYIKRSSFSYIFYICHNFKEFP